MYRILLKPLRSNVIGSVLAAIGSSLMSAVNNENQHQHQLEYMDKSIGANIQQWNRENDYNTPANQMARFKDAGLNPNLIYGQSNESSSMTPSQGVPEAKMPVNPVSQGVQAYNNTRLMDAQIENIQADTDKKKVEAGNSTEMVNLQRRIVEDTERRTDLMIKDFESKKDLRGARAEWYRTSVNKMEEEVKNVVIQGLILGKDLESYDERLGANIKEVNARAEAYIAQADLDEQKKKNLQREYFEMVETFEDRCQKIKSEVNMNNATQAEKMAVAEKLIMEAVSLGGSAAANLASYSEVQKTLQNGKFDSVQEKLCAYYTSALTLVIREVFGIGISIRN